jgi:hypothetical protein
MSLFSALLLFCSDREGLQAADTVERIETDIALALQSQLLVSHGEPLLFARLLQLVVNLRAMTTQYLEAILNSPLQTEAQVNLQSNPTPEQSGADTGESSSAESSPQDPMPSLIVSTTSSSQEEAPHLPPSTAVQTHSLMEPPTLTQTPSESPSLFTERSTFVSATDPTPSSQLGSYSSNFQSQNAPFLLQQALRHDIGIQRRPAETIVRQEAIDLRWVGTPPQFNSKNSNHSQRLQGTLTSPKTSSEYGDQMRTNNHKQADPNGSNHTGEH